MVNTYLVLFVFGFWFCGRTMARPYIIFLYGFSDAMYCVPTGLFFCSFVYIVIVLS